MKIPTPGELTKRFQEAEDGELQTAISNTAQWLEKNWTPVSTNSPPMPHNYRIAEMVAAEFRKAGWVVSIGDDQRDGAYWSFRASSPGGGQF